MERLRKSDNKALEAESWQFTFHLVCDCQGMMYSNWTNVPKTITFHTRYSILSVMLINPIYALYNSNQEKSHL
jgi:hypothetical protein